MVFGKNLKCTPVERATAGNVASSSVDCAVAFVDAAVLAPGWYLLGFEIPVGERPAALAELVVTGADGRGSAIPLRLSPGPRQRLLIRTMQQGVPSVLRGVELVPARQGSVVRLRRLLAAEALLRLLVPQLPRPLLSGRSLALVAAGAWRILSARSRTPLASTLGSLYSRSAMGAGDASYLQWLAQWDRDARAGSTRLRDRVARIARRPLVSILVPTWETPEAELRACFDSVLAQSCDNWELCIADDASTSPHVQSVIREYVALDARIRCTIRTENGHISAASNSALALATGEFIALLDHDDVLAPDALAWMTACIDANPDCRLLYSDEDKIDGSGRRFDPYFKPDCNLELLRGQNMVSHLGVYATALVREVGGFRAGFEGSQDHDLALRCLERLSPRQVCHVPAVLYHWRASAGSTARAAGAKPYAQRAALAAVSAHLSRCGEQASVEPLGDGMVRVQYRLPPEAPLVDVIIPTRDRLDLLAPCVASLLAVTGYPRFRILVVDNGSSDPACLAWLRAMPDDDPRVRVIRIDEPFNYARLNNLAAAGSDAEVLAFVNNDIEATDPSWLSAMVAQAIRPGVGAVGAMLLYPDGSIQHAGLFLGVNGVAAHAYRGCPADFPGQMGRLLLAQEVSAVTGACLVTRRECYREARGMDEELAVAFNDVDYCLKLRSLGYRVIWTPLARLLHRESASRGGEVSTQQRERLQREERHLRERWGVLLEHDPAYNPNLSRTGIPFSLDQLRRPPSVDPDEALAACVPAPHARART